MRGRFSHIGTRRHSRLGAEKSVNGENSRECKYFFPARAVKVVGGFNKFSINYNYFPTDV